MPNEFFQQCSEICRDVGEYLLGYQRLTFPYFVLHDHVHSRNVYRNYLSIVSNSGLFQSLPPPIDALINCSSYLHDVGMSLPISFINELRLTVHEISDDSPEVGNKVKSCPSFLKDGHVYFPEKYSEKYTISLPKEVADLIRTIHPWLSSKYTTATFGFRKILSEEVPEKSSVKEAFLRALSTIIKYHSSKIDLRTRPREEKILDYRIDVVQLAAILRLADALDISKKRTKHAFDAWKGLFSDKPSQLKHWFFKWSIDKVEVKRGEISIRITPSEDKYEEIGKIIGVALFELGDNVAKDYNAYLEIINRPFQFNIVLPTSQKVAVDLSELKQCYKTVTDTPLYRSIISQIPSTEVEFLSLVRDLEERFNKEAISLTEENCKGNKTTKPDSLDLLAQSLYMKRGYSVIIEKLKGIKCVKYLLQQFKYEQ